MPPSKRNRIIPTSKTHKDRKALTRRLHTNIQTAASTYAAIYVFSVHNMRNSFLKDVRAHLAADSRLFMGKTKLMAHALGGTAETEILPGLNGLNEYLSGEVGLLFTDREAGEVQRYFEGLAQLDYARAGAVAARSFTIPRGELTTRYGVEGGEDDPLPMAIEPTLRKLGVPTRIVKGKVVLEDGAEDSMADEEGYAVCREGDVLDSRQTAILKIFGARMAEFRIELKAVYDKATESVRQIGEMEVD